MEFRGIAWVPEGGACVDWRGDVGEDVGVVVGVDAVGCWVEWHDDKLIVLSKTEDEAVQLEINGSSES